MDLQNQRVINSGCLRHMTWNMSYLTDYEEIDRGYVAFGGNPKEGKNTRQFTIKLFNLIMLLWHNGGSCCSVKTNIELPIDPNDSMLMEDDRKIDSQEMKKKMGKLTKTLSSKRNKGDILLFISLCGLYIFGSTKMEQSIAFENVECMRNFPDESWFTEVKTASTSMETQKPVLEDEDDEAVYKELVDGLVRAATTAFSLEAAQDSVCGPGAKNHGDTISTKQGFLIWRRLRPHQHKEIVSNPLIIEEIYSCKELNLMKKKDERKKAEKEEEANIALIETWDDIQAKIDVDHQLAKRMQAQEQEEFGAIEEKGYIISTLNMEGYKIKDLKLNEFDSIKDMFDRAFKRVNTFEDFRTDLVKGKEKRAGTKLVQEITKKQKSPSIVVRKIINKEEKALLSIKRAEKVSKCTYLVVVRLPDLKLKTLAKRGIKCIFVGYAEHSKAFRFYIIEPNDSVAINSIIESRDAIFDEHRVTDKIVQQSEPRKSKRHRTPKDFGPEFQLYLIEGTKDEVSHQHSYCFNVEDDPKTFDEAMKSQDVAFWKEAINDEMDSIMGNKTWVYL
ncbi:hypothetical protein Tco_0560695 [Tanacetum coccineum]